MRWNKEKLVLGASLAVLALVTWTTVPAWTSGGEGLRPVANPQAAGGGATPGRRMPWYEVADVEGRSPFASASGWQTAEPDPLPLPPVTQLERRLPLPALVHGSFRARPLKEATPPEPKED